MIIESKEEFIETVLILDSKDSNRANNTPEPSTSMVVSNEEDSSFGDCIKDSKVNRDRSREQKSNHLFYFRMHQSKNLKNDQPLTGFAANCNILHKPDVK